MTKLETLLKCKKIWQFLVKNPTIRDKEVAYTTLNLDNDLNQCPACEFTEYWNSPNCSKCPIVWGTEAIQNDYFCESQNKYTIETPWDKWSNRNNSNTERNLGAKRMVRLINKTIKELK